jgi:hypothetical protein
LSSQRKEGLGHNPFHDRDEEGKAFVDAKQKSILQDAAPTTPLIVSTNVFYSI